MTTTSQVDLLTRAKAVVEREAQAVEALVDQFDASLERLVALILNCKGHVLVTGAGTSRAVAERFAHLLSCCGTPGLFVSAADSLHGGAGAITANDVVFIISKGGHSAEINQFAELAKTRGALVIAQTENPESPLAQISDAVYKVKAIGDVDPYGMIATGSSLVNAAACDVLCVLLLERRGYTKEEFGVTHPGGAVGKKLAEEHK
jgi:D-arabinose 5-phosphate isomerase GutQ